MSVKVFTDGSCLKNGGEGFGGYACIISYNGELFTYSKGEESTTNNRMEMKGVICGLHEVYKLINKSKIKKGNELIVYSDSAYVINSLNKNWLDLWKRNGWITSNNKSVKNVDLWLELSMYIDKLKDCGWVKQIRFEKVKGHDGILLNEKADEMARKEALKIKNGVE